MLVITLALAIKPKNGGIPAIDSKQTVNVAVKTLL
jgi:hypothetical protein